MKVNFHIKQMCWSLILEQQTQSTGRPGKSGEKVEQTFPQNPGQCFTPLPSAVFSCFFFFSQCQWCSMIRSLFELSRSPHTNYFLLIGVFKGREWEGWRRKASELRGRNLNLISGKGGAWVFKPLTIQLLTVSSVWCFSMCCVLVE